MLNLQLKTPEYVQPDTHHGVFLQWPHRQQDDTSITPRGAQRVHNVYKHRHQVYLNSDVEPEVLNVFELLLAGCSFAVDCKITE